MTIQNPYIDKIDNIPIDKPSHTSLSPQYVYNYICLSSFCRSNYTADVLECFCMLDTNVLKRMNR